MDEEKNNIQELSDEELEQAVGGVSFIDMESEKQFTLPQTEKGQKQHDRKNR